MRTLAGALAALSSVAMLLPETAAAQATTVIVREEVPYPLFEAGVQAGVLTGLSAKYWLTPYHGITGGLTWSFPDEGYSFHLDYVGHSYVLRDSLREPDRVHLPLYAGVGAKALRLSSDEPVFGARFPLGAEALLVDLPVSFFAEIAPGALFVREGPEFSADAGIGARVYF